MHRYFLSTVLMVAILLATGCSGTSNPAIPDPGNLQGLTPQAQYGTHVLWGSWDVAIDLETLEVTIIPDRTSNLHVNVISHIEPPSGSTMGISNISIDGTVVGCDIALMHPFPGLNQYAGFDVRGILIADGSVTGYNDSDVVLAGPDETRLLNADGFTRWWNPVEFPDNGTMFSYRDGKLGNPFSTAGYGATLNPYKVFADSLDTDDPLLMLVDPGLPNGETRAVFKPGYVNTRHYEIQFPDDGSGLPLVIFNYAIDASWEPVSPPPSNLPDDFPIHANCVEPFYVEVQVTGNTLYYTGTGETGGSIGLDINVHDWQGALGDGGLVANEVNNVSIESLTCLNGLHPATLVPGSGMGETYSTWHAELSGEPPSGEDQMFLVTVESSNGDWQPEFTGWDGSAPLSAYATAWAQVGDTPPSSSTLTLLVPNGGESWQSGCPYSIEWESDGDPIDNVMLEYSTDGFIADINEIINSTPNDGEYDWELTDLVSDTLRVRISDVLDPGTFDISDGDFSTGTPGPADWPTQKNDYQNSGVSPYDGPTTDNLLWDTNIMGEMTPGPVIGADGTIYTGTNDGRFVAVEPDGDIIYELDLGSFVLGSASITEEGRIYVGSWGSPTGYLYAIECGGDITWQFDCGGNINHATPVIGSDGTVYIGNNNGDFYAINPDGTQKWLFDIPGGGFTPSPALGSDGKIYVCSTNGHVYGLTDNGQGSYTIAWDHYFTGEHMGCPPTVDTDSPLVDNDVIYVSGLYDWTLYACDPVTDTILWTGAMGQGTSESSATVGPDHTVYIGCNDSLVYAFNQDGSVKWTYTTGQQVTAAPIIDPDGRLYVPSRDFYIYCLDTTDNGSLIWSYETGDIIRTEVAIAPDGTMYCGGHDGHLRAFQDE
jgi:outer membrane protein assembly factor BamB